MSYYPFPAPATPAKYIKSVTKAAISGSTTLLAFYIVNDNTATRYLWIKDATSTFSSSDSSSTALYVIPLQGRSTMSLGHTFWGMTGTLFSTGLSWGISTSATSYTDATATDHVFLVQKA